MGPMPIIAAIPPDVDLTAIEQQLKETGVAVLNPALQSTIPQLEQVVHQAEAKGVQNFKVIVLAHDYVPDTSLRDLGMKVSKDLGGKMTVLVMSPGQVAGQSNQLTRFQIEKGQDGHGIGARLPLSNPPVAASTFVDIATGATTSWTGITWALIAVVAVAAGIGRVVTRRKSRAVDAARKEAALAGASSGTAVQAGADGDRPAGSAG
ncbi:Rv1476 family membrane protein [Tsukamurella soli]|uniref:Uncharacterized protein n=1 Tax=Tsukamurella soli TaxID=644556 RepID=A0ABP8KK25_9ACTN